MRLSLHSFVTPAVVFFAATLLPSLSTASGHIDSGTVVSAPHGSFNGVQYQRYEAMFEGVSSQNRPYRVPCQIIAPVNHSSSSGLLLFDWLVPSTIATAVGQEQADARYTLTDNFLFGRGLTYATVRCDPAGIGQTSPIIDASRPWSDDLLDTSSEFITSAGDEFEIVADYMKALRTDSLARSLTGPINRTAAFGYSASGFKLRGLLRINMGRGLFDFSLVGGTGQGFDRPINDVIEFSNSERPPQVGAGLEIDFQSETDVMALEAHKTRHEEPNYRVYQFAGASHLRNLDAAVFGLADPDAANPADWVPFFRALFVAGDRWSLGVCPPPSIWLGAQNQANIHRDANENALVRFVGGQRVNTTAYRLPEVAVGQNQYIALDPSYNDGSFPGLLRMLAGGHVDLTSNFTNHTRYVRDVRTHARRLQAQGYLLEGDADAIILRAIQSDIGK